MRTISPEKSKAYEKAIELVLAKELTGRRAAQKYGVSYAYLMQRVGDKRNKKPAPTDETAKLRKLLKEAEDRFDAQAESFTKRFTAMHDEIDSLKAQLGGQATSTRKSAAKPAPTFLSLGAMQQEVNRLIEEFRACTDPTEQTRIKEEIDMLQAQLDAV